MMSRTCEIEGIKPSRLRVRNPVAKHTEEFNKPKTHRDVKNDYKRNSKYKTKYTKEVYYDYD